MSSVEEKAIKKAKAKDAKAKKAAAAVKTGEKGKPGPVRTSGRKPKISKEMDIDLGDNEEEIDFPPNGGSDLARSAQIQLIRSVSDLEEAKVVARNDSGKEMSEEEKAENKSYDPREGKGYLLLPIRAVQ